MSRSEDFNALRDQLLAKGLTQAMRLRPAPSSTRWKRQHPASEQLRPARCGSRLQGGDPRYIYEVFRSTPEELVFAEV